MRVLYNEWDEPTAAWLRELINGRHLPPGRSIPGQSEMFGRTICETSTSAISLPASADGRSPCAGQDLKERPASGPDHRPASPSPLLEKGLARLMIGTLLPSGSNSSASASLGSFLGNRLRQQFGSAGSMIYSIRWKDAATPAGRQYCQLVASARRISASDCSSERSGWNTPTCNVFNQPETARGLRTLAGQAKTAGWPTPTKTDSERGEKYNPFAPNMTLNMAAQRAGWPTPTTRDHKDGQECPNVPTNSLLGREVRLSGWHTPLARDGDKLDATPPAIEKRMRNGREIGTAMEARMTSAGGWSEHPGPIRITASGQVLTGSDAATASSGQLNPAHSRWLQGFPPEWDACAVTAMQSYPRSRRNSSRNSSAQSPTCKTKG